MKKLSIGFQSESRYLACTYATWYYLMHHEATVFQRQESFGTTKVMCFQLRGCTQNDSTRLDLYKRSLFRFKMDYGIPSLIAKEKSSVSHWVSNFNVKSNIRWNTHEFELALKKPKKISSNQPDSEVVYWMLLLE
jgi:hypothetical protein